MTFLGVLTPEEGAAFGIPSSTFVISFPPARPSQTSQKTSSLPSASGSTTSSGTASSRASSEARPETGVTQAWPQPDTGVTQAWPPMPDQFETKELYEEALGEWRSRVGRILGMGA